MGQPDLFIPHKTTKSPVSQPDYKNDMRAIEIWAKGLKSGSSAGAVSTFFNVGNAVPSATFGGFVNAALNGGTVSLLSPIFAGDTGYPPGEFFSGTIIDTVIGGAGWYSVATSASAYRVMQAPQVFAPSFTGPTPTIGIILLFRTVQVLTAPGTPNSLIVASKQIDIPSQGHHLFQVSDFLTPTIVGADLSFITATGATIASSGGLPYISGCSVIAVWDAANTFTQE